MPIFIYCIISRGGWFWNLKNQIKAGLDEGKGDLGNQNQAGGDDKDEDLETQIEMEILQRMLNEE